MEEIGEHIDPTLEITLEEVKKKALKGVAILTSRSFLLQAISVVAQLLLWAFIDASEYGVFLIVSASINFLSYFADIGLGAALIQKKEKPTAEDFKTVFFVQELLVLTVVIIVFLISPVLVKTHSLSHEAIILLYALNVSFFLASLKNIPSIMLERKLDFGKFVIPQLIETVVYNVVLVFFAWKGFGITSFTYAVLIRGIVGLVIIYILQPWKPGFALSKKSLKSLLKFGVPYQLNNFLATVKDDGLTIVLGGILGSQGLGMLGFAQKVTQLPLRFVLDNVTKVTFPAFSRMQEDKEILRKPLEMSILFICALVYPCLIGIIVLFPVITTVIPRYQQWNPAFIAIVLVSLNSMIACVSTQLTNLLNAIGKIRTTFKLMVMWTSLSWILIPFVSKKWMVNGAAAGYTIVGLSSFIVFILIKKYINWSIFNTVIKPLLAALLMGVVLFILRGLFSYTIFNFILLIILGILLYVTFLYLMVGQSLVEDVKKTITSIFSKK